MHVSRSLTTARKSGCSLAMRFSFYRRGNVIAYAFDARGAVGLRRPDGVGLLRTSDGVPRSVIDGHDVVDVVEILACVAGNFDERACAQRGVEVDP